MALLALISGQLVTCAAPGVHAREASMDAGPGVSLAWASTQYGLHEPEGAVVVLDVIVRNTTEDVTQATSIEWEPAFAATFHVLDSDPPAWRVHRTDEGWGVLDTSGIPANEDGHFRVWFGAVADPLPGDVEGPRVRV